MNVYTKEHELIRLANAPFSSGGEGEVRTVERAPARFTNVCAKIYHQQKQSAKIEQKINFMVSNPPAQISGNGFMIGWPLAAIYNSSAKFIGFLMPIAPTESKQLVNLTAKNLSKKLAPIWHQKYDRALGKDSLIARLKLINNISIPIHLLHDTGKYVLKDLKPQNILVTHTGQITIVDMDSIQIMDGSRLLFPGTAATDQYMPPEFYTQKVGIDASKPLDKSWDLFALAVVYYQILFGLHPFVVTPWVIKDDSAMEISQNIAQGLFPFGANAHKVRSYPPLHNNFKLIPPQIQKLFVKALGEQPSLRPSAMSWGKAVHDILQQVRTSPSPAPKPPPAPKPSPTPTPAPDSPKQADFLDVSATNLQFSADGGSKTIVIKSSPAWSIGTGLSSWGHISRVANNLTVRVDANLFQSSRNDWFTIISGTQTAKVVITQEAKNEETMPIPQPTTDYSIAPSEIDHFNWGAFFFAPIWGLCHGLWVPLLVAIASFVCGISNISPLQGIASTGSFVYYIIFAYKANALAWKKRQWKDISDCINSQKKWTKAGWWLVVISIVISIIALTV